MLDSGGSIIGSVRAKEDRGTVYIGKYTIVSKNGIQNI